MRPPDKNEGTMDAREFLIDFCRAQRDSKLRWIESMAKTPSSTYLDGILNDYQVQADQWHTCLKWLEAQSEA